MTDPTDHDNLQENAQRRERLGKATQANNTTTPSQLNHGYSRFIRMMKLVLPLIALIITAIVFTWGNMSDDNIVPLDGTSAAPKTIGKNELLNPRFESTDEKKQPYTITAKRALQGETNEDLVILDEPIADILLNNGNWIALKADQGAFRQDNQRLLLKGDVNLFHDQGYQIQTVQLQLDLEKNTAWSEEKIYGQGPAGTIESMGLKADTASGNLIFTGPAKLIISRSASDISIEGL